MWFHLFLIVGITTISLVVERSWSCNYSIAARISGVVFLVSMTSHFTFILCVHVPTDRQETWSTLDVLLWVRRSQRCAHFVIFIFSLVTITLCTLVFFSDSTCLNFNLALVLYFFFSSVVYIFLSCWSCHSALTERRIHSEPFSL